MSESTSGMSERSKSEYLAVARARYRGRGRAGRSRLLDEVCEVCGLSRKHAIKVLGGRAGTKGRRGRSGRGRKYGVEVGRVVHEIWKRAEQPCSVRLVAALPGWLGSYEKRHGALEVELREKVLGASARTLERLLAAKKAGRNGRRWHGRGSHGLKQQIEVRCGRWEVAGPGWMEADTVSHGGGASSGDYLWSVTLTDIYSGWTELRAVWNCGGSGVRAAVEEIEEALCFDLLGFDCDNGPEFLNQHLKRYFERGRKRRQALFWTRSRPYRKNDQAHVEQKNFTHVRQLLGYERLDDVRLVEAVNALYREAWGPLHNYFCPVMKLKEKRREGGRWIKRYDTPATPCERLLACATLESQTKERLWTEREQLDPFALSEKVESHLRRIARLRQQITAERSLEQGWPDALAVGAAASAMESLRSSYAPAATPTAKPLSISRLTHPNKQTKTKPSPVSLNMAQPLAA